MDEHESECPPWCVSEHDGPLRPGGGQHHGEPRYVAVVLGRDQPDEPGRRAVAGELVVVVSQWPTDHEPWVEIAEPECADRVLRITPESLRRLVGVIDPGTGLPR